MADKDTTYGQCDICKEWKALNPDGLCQGCVDDLIEEYQQMDKEALEDYRASTMPGYGRVDNSNGYD